MPSKKKKYNARFPPARIKKIMQMDEDVGKVAATVPVIISRALELFIESLIVQASQTTVARNAKTLSTSHIKQTIESESKYSFLHELVANIPDHQVEEDNSEPMGASENQIKRARGRPKKSQDGTGGRQKRERRKKMEKQESSESSESPEDSEETDDAAEESDEDPLNNHSNMNNKIPDFATTSMASMLMPPPSTPSPVLPAYPTTSIFPPGISPFSGMPRTAPLGWPYPGSQVPGMPHISMPTMPMPHNSMPQMGMVQMPEQMMSMTPMSKSHVHVSSMASHSAKHEDDDYDT